MTKSSNFFSLRSESSKCTFFFSSNLFSNFCRFSLFFYFTNSKLFSLIFFNLQQIFQPYKCSKCLLAREAKALDVLFFPTSSQILPILPIFSIFFYFHQFSVIFFNLQQIFQPYKCSKCLLDLNVLIFSFFFQPLLKFLQIFSILLFSPMFNYFQLFFQS